MFFELYNASLYCFPASEKFGIIFIRTCRIFAKKYMGREWDCSSSLSRKGWRNTMPDVTQKEIGRRLYHVHREKRVEEAIKKIKHGVGTAWSSFNNDDIELLGHLLQCTWNTVDQKIWENIPFSHMTKNDVRNILSFGEGVSPGKNPDTAAVNEIKKILLSLA